MGLYIGNSEIIDCYIGSTQAKEAWIGSTQVYPASLSYVIQSINLYYSTSSQILANASNYAYALGTVNVYRGSQLVRTITNAPLTPYALSDTTHFYADGNYVKGYHLHTTPVSSSYSTSASWVYSTSSAVSSNSITQQTNISSPTVTSAYVSCVPEEETINVFGGSIKCYLGITRTITYTWTSGDESQGTDHGGGAYVYINGSYVSYITHNNYINVSFSENQSLSTVTKTVRMAYAGDESYYDQESIVQSAGYYTYAKPSIYTYGCSDVPANGGTSYFYGYASQTYGWNNRTSGVGTLYPSVSWSTSSYSGSNLGKNRTSRTLLGSSQGSCTSQGMSADRVTAYCYQEANEKTTTSEIGDKQYGTPTVTGTDTRNPSTSISASSYTSSSSPCPAYGGDTTLSYSASRQERDIISTPWTRYITYYYSWTSGASETSTSVYDTGSDTSYGSWATVAYTPTISGYADGFDREGTAVSIYDRMTETGNARNVTYTATFDGASNSVTIYQQENQVINTSTTTEYEGRNHIYSFANDNYEVWVIPTGDHLNQSASGFTISLTTSANHTYHEYDTYDKYSRTKTTYTYTSLHTEYSYSAWSYVGRQTDETEMSIETDTVGVSQVGSWFTATTSSISAGANTSSARSGSVTYYNSGDANASYTTNISQLAGSYLKLYDPDGYEIPEGRSISLLATDLYMIKVSSSASWTMTTPTLPTTITISPKSGNAGDTNVTLRTRNAPSRSLTCNIRNGSDTRELVINVNM